MKVTAILSQEQKTCLESVYTFLQGATVYLQAVEHVAYPEDVVPVKGLVELGSLCMSRMLECFPDVVEFRGKGGVTSWRVSLR